MFARKSVLPMISYSSLLIWFLASMALTASLLFILVKLRLGRFLLDEPSPRSMHRSPVPRMGGLAIMVSFAFLCVIYQPHGWVTMVPSLVVLVVFSFFDDYRSLPVLSRLCVQLVAAILLALQLLSDNVNAIGQFAASLQSLGNIGSCILLLLLLIWIMNLYNFMDGANGLAGGMTIIGFIAYGAAASLAGSDNLAFFAIVISGAALGFLFFNFAPARIFMGDAGSIPLGFLAGALGLMGNLQNAWPWWFPPLVFSPFIVDATVTLIKRACQRKKIWVAHREHYYQRLVLMGWSHKRLALTEYVLMLACAGSALYALQLPAQQFFLGSAISVQHTILIGWCLVYLTLGVTLEIVFSRHQNSLPKTT